MAFCFYVALQGIYNATPKKDGTPGARLDRKSGALVYPSIDRKGAEAHLARLLKSRDFVCVGKVKPCVIEITAAPGNGSPRIGAEAIAAFFAHKGRTVVGGTDKLPRQVAAAIGKGIDKQGKPAQVKPTTTRKVKPEVVADDAVVVDADAPAVNAVPTVEALIASGTQRKDAAAVHAAMVDAAS